jgi:hypothetical protein
MIAKKTVAINDDIKSKPRGLQYLRVSLKAVETVLHARIERPAKR